MPSVDSTPKICPHFQETEVSNPEGPETETVYHLNILAAFAIAKYWEDVRAGILRLADGDKTVLVSEVFRIIEEPVTEIVRMFNNVLAPV